MFEDDKYGIGALIDAMFYPKLEYRSIPKDYNMAKNVKSKICAECGGQCCKICGCHFSPDDFKEISFDYLKREILEKKYISITHVDGEAILQDVGVYILRIRNEGCPIADFTLGRHQCSLLTDTGCSLSYEERPTGGRLLIPSDKVSNGLFSSENRKCVQKYSLEDCCYEWKPHQRILADLAAYFRD